MTPKYQVLARRYRPQQFRDVVGQEVIITTLKNSLRLSKVAHAYLFCGSRGTGKTTLARLFAKTLNCQNLSPEFEPCNGCSSCLDITGGQSLDVIEIDGASNRGIDDIRQINEQIGYVPSHGRYKIYIIDEVHMLTKEAFNALLKTLEEPPEQAKFFFATTEPHKVLPTIISRCQRFDLKRIPLEKIIDKLGSIARDLSRDVQMDALHLIGEKSDGSLRDAESLLDQILCFSDGTITQESVQKVFGLVSTEHFFALDAAFSEYRLAYPFELAQHLHEEGKEFAHVFSQLVEHYRKIALCKTFGDQATASPYSDRYATSARLYTQQQSLYILEYLLGVEAQLHKSLVPRIVFENTLLHIVRSKNRIPAEVLLRKLSELQAAGSPIALTIPSAETEKNNSSITSGIERPTPKEPKTVAVPELTATAIPEVKTTPTPELEPQRATEPKTAPLPETKPQTASETKSIAPADSPLPFTKPAPKAKESQGAKSPGHRYDTLIRFAAVELEGSVKK